MTHATCARRGTPQSRHRVGKWLAEAALGCGLLWGTSAFAQDVLPIFEAPPVPVATSSRNLNLPLPAPATDMERRLQDLEQQFYMQQQHQAQLQNELDASKQRLQQLTSAAATYDLAPAPGTPAAEGYDVGSDLTMSAKWNNGLEVASKNKDFRIHVGGRTQFDAAWFSVDQNLYNADGTPTSGLSNDYGDGVDFRRGRLRVDGTMYEVIDFAVEYDFFNSATLGPTPLIPTVPFTPSNLQAQPRPAPAPTDLWVMFKYLPVVQNVKVGNQKEAIGFEHIVSSRFLPFMERSFNQDTFYGGLYNGFTPGIAALGTWGGDEQLGTYNIGLFKPTNNVSAFSTGDGDYSVTGRLSRLLMYEDDGLRLVHVGLSGRAATAVSQALGSNGATTTERVIQYRTRDAVRAGLSAAWPTPANITLFGDETQQVNAEFVAVSGRWTWQSEYLVSVLHDARASTADPLGNSVTYHGGYCQLLYFLTDDHDHYSKTLGAFERVSPNENAFRVRDENGCSIFGRGAWQVGARYNFLDLNDQGLNGGMLHNGTFGVNWFLNPNMKLQFNYSMTYRDAPIAGGLGDGWINGWGTRLAWDF